MRLSSAPMGTPRTVEVEVGADGAAVWPEGTLELAPAVESQIAQFAPLSLLELDGDYTRPSRYTKILRVRAPARLRGDTVAAGAGRVARRGAVGSPCTRAPSGIRLERRGRYAQYRATLANRFDTARECFVAALRAGVPWEAAAPLARAWCAFEESGAPLSLDPEVQTRLLEHVWTASRWQPWPWEFRVNPVVAAAHFFLSGRHEVEYPWHFGGKRVDPPLALLRPWLEARFDELATPQEAEKIWLLRAAKKRERVAWLAASQARDEQLEEEAYQDMLARHPPDSEDSPPDAAEPSEPLERDQVVSRWVEFSTTLEAEEPSEVDEAYRRAAGDLCRLYRDRAGGSAARAYVLALDAATIVAALEPALVPRVERVVFVTVRLTAGLVVVRLRGGEESCVLQAPTGAFGDWRLVRGVDDEVVLALPREAQPAARLALAAADATRESIGAGTVRRFPRDLDR